MPRYVYDCADCMNQFETQHSYSFKDVVCEFCGSRNVNKNLSKVVNVKRRVGETSKTVGQEVNKAIDDNRQELETMRKKIQGKVYKK